MSLLISCCTTASESLVMLHCRVLIANAFNQRAKPCTDIAQAWSASTRFSNPRNPWPRQCESGRENRMMTFSGKIRRHGVSLFDMN